MEQSDSVERFSNRVENYVKYRPSYPAEVLNVFRDEMGLNSESLVADIGSGTGISSKLFLDSGNVVYGVEPNAKMREAAAEFLAAYPNFYSIDGTSTATNLFNASVNIITAAQAFHWFEPEPTRKEFKRILKPGGWVALMWNERQLDTTPFLIEYEKLLLKYANDYTKVRHDNINETTLKNYFQGDFRTATFANKQVLDFDGIKGRVSSSLYMPSESDRQYSAMVEELQTLFDKHAENDRIQVFYDTNVFYKQY
ncbi:MAG TPA: methyltransferase domain-containing protein [Pyrinomonadaceae bacterium]|nr:methyltransferase domain-containing protein [Pyrinomonadaceae bacterium]